VSSVLPQARRGEGISKKKEEGGGKSQENFLADLNKEALARKKNLDPFQREWRKKKKGTEGCQLLATRGPARQPRRKMPLQYPPAEKTFA